MRTLAGVLLMLAASHAGADEAEISRIEEVRALTERYGEIDASVFADRTQATANGGEEWDRFVQLDQSFASCRHTLARYDKAHDAVAGEARYRKIMKQHADEAEEQARQVETERPELAESLRRQGSLSSREFGLHEESQTRAESLLETVRSEWETMRTDCVGILEELEALVATVE